MTDPNPSPAPDVPVALPYAAARASYASFGQRLGAWMIDSVLLLLIRVGVLAVLGVLLNLTGDPDHWPEWVQATVGLFIVLLMIACGWLYRAIPEASHRQATVGKRAMGIKVADIEDGRATFSQTSVRYFARFLSTLTLGFGFLMILFTKRHQALHDIGANCVVVHI